MTSYCMFKINHYPLLCFINYWNVIMIKFDDWSLFWKHNFPQTIRKFPVILPHQLFPWLMRSGAWPKDDDVGPSKLAHYWHHFEGRASWKAPQGLERDLHPIYIWGDDVQFTENHEKLIVVLVGHVLDRRTYSCSSCWPLFTIREDSWWCCSDPHWSCPTKTTCTRGETVTRNLQGYDSR